MAGGFSIGGQLGPLSGGVSIGPGAISAGVSIGAFGGPGFAPAPATPFQATLCPCSFRGVGFIVEEFGGEVGRRGEIHQYPLRDIPNAEDLGRRARQWRWRAYVLGDDALAQWSALCAALEQQGSGILILPDGSPVSAQVDPKQGQRYTLVLDKQRKISFELSFYEAGQTLYPGGSADTQANSLSAGSALDSAANSDQQNATSAVGGPTTAQAQQNFQNANETLLPPTLGNNNPGNALGVNTINSTGADVLQSQPFGPPVIDTSTPNVSSAI